MVFGEACTNSSVQLGAMMLQTSFCVHFGVFLGAVEGQRRDGDGFLSGRYFSRAQNRELSHKNVAKDAAPGWGGVFCFFKESDDVLEELEFVAELGAVAVEVLLLSREKM